MTAATVGVWLEGTDRAYIQMAGHPLPEILRLSLQDLALRIKILKVKIGNTIAEGLSRALDPPLLVNITRAVNSLIEVGALTQTEQITPMGLLLSRLPVDVHLGEHDCSRQIVIQMSLKALPLHY
jgi:HrpA-like RNA helicase